MPTGLRSIRSSSSHARDKVGSAVNTISIGGTERSLGDADAGWVRHQFSESLRKGRLPCVRIAIHTTRANVTLQTRNCSASGGGNRQPNADEKANFDLWNMEGLNSVPFTERAVADLVARVKRLIH